MKHPQKKTSVGKRSWQPLKAKVHAGSLSVMLLLMHAPVGASTFELNFQQHGTPVAGINAALGQIGKGANIGTFDGTRFNLDIVNIGGQDYFHVVVEDANSDFRQESYTSAVVMDATSQTCTGTPCVRSFSPDSGGMERSMISNRDIRFGVLLETGIIGNWNPYNRVGNARDPFGRKQFTRQPDFSVKETVLPVSERYRISGTGTMNPSRTVLRMQASDANVSIEVYKPFLDKKPRITQTLNENNVVSQFVADMTGLTYSDLNLSATFSNTLTVTDPNLPVPGGADFDMSMAQQPNVTAGKFIYTPGNGWSAPTDPTGSKGWDVDDSTFDPGTYTYSEGNFDVLNIDWTSFFDPSQNPNSFVDMN